MVGRVISALIRRIDKIKYRGHPVEYARHLGVKIGRDCKIHADPDNCFSTEPFLITIGDHVLITNGVRFLTHDGSGFTLAYEERNAYYDIWGPIRIGNNVYIGTDAMILPNVEICDNVIIAAGAVVTKSILEDGVYAGVPAKRLKSFQEYQEAAKRKAVNNFGLSFEERKKKFLALHPEWFNK